FGANLLAALEAQAGVETAVLCEASARDVYPNSRTLVVDHDSTFDQPQISSIDHLIQLHQFLARPADLPTTTVVHDLHVFDVAWKYGPGRDRLVEVFETNVLMSRWVASHFPATIDALASRYPTIADRLVLLEAPTLLEDFDLADDARQWARDSFSLDTSVPSLLYPAQLQAHKNHWNLLAALAILFSEGQPIRLILTGSSFREHHLVTLQTRAEQLGIGDLVHFAGYVSGEELRGLYAEVDAVISPSFAEGGAYIAQEAVIHGRPVACSNIASAVAHLERLDLQIPLFDPFVVSEIVSAIRDLIDNGESITNGYANALDIESSWTWEAMAAQLVELSTRAEPVG
ncbi:MAG: glycosyltransferase, partial [Acidimicrobiaceae bacterium]|nr:glycosyltransferase [Acidimicrobiaceae bacterium]